MRAAEALSRFWTRALTAPRRATCVVLAFALLLRVVFALTRPGEIEFPDGYRYTSIAHDLVAGRGLKRDRAYRCVWPDDTTHWGMGYVAHFHPGYPVFLAALHKIGLRSAVAVRLVQAALGAVTVWLVILLARRLFDGECALAAGVVAACEPFLVFFTGLVLTETLFTFLLTASLVFLVLPTGVPNDVPKDGQEGAPGRSCFRAVAWGALAGLAVMVRSTFLLFAPFVALADMLIARRGRRRSRVLWHAVALLAFAATLAPWTVRNAVRLGTFVPGSTRLGMSVYAAFAPETTGGWDLEKLSWPREELAPLGEVGRDRLLLGLGLASAAGRPFRSAYLVFPKLGRLWSPVPWAEGYVSVSYWAVGTLAFLGLVGMAAVCCVARRSGWRAWWPVLAPAAYVTLVTTVFPGSLRFRVPAHAGLCVLAGAGWLTIASWLRSRAHAESTATAA